MKLNSKHCLSLIQSGVIAHCQFVFMSRNGNHLSRNLVSMATMHFLLTCLKSNEYIIWFPNH